MRPYSVAIFFEIGISAIRVMGINVAKNRNGATGVCKVLFEPTVGRFLILDI